MWAATIRNRTRGPLPPARWRKVAVWSMGVCGSDAQCSMPWRDVGAESVCISGVTGGCQQLTVLEAEVSLTRKERQNHAILTDQKFPGIDCFSRGYFKDPKGLLPAFGITGVETEEIRQLNTLLDLSENLSAVRLLRVEEWQILIAITGHCGQCCTDQDSVTPVHEIICELQQQGVVCNTCSACNSPLWPMCKSDGEWRLTTLISSEKKRTNWKRDNGLWRGLGCLRSDWYWNTAPLGTPTTSAALEIQRGSPFHILFTHHATNATWNKCISWSQSEVW